MIGGAFSFRGLKAVGGWQDPRGRIPAVGGANGPARRHRSAKPEVGPAEDIASPKPKAPSKSKSKVARRRPCDGRAEDAKSQVTCIAMTLLVMWLLASPVWLDAD